MRAVLIKGEPWRVVGVEPGDPRLIDREGKATIGTTDPLTRTIHLSCRLEPPLLDRVLLHEVAHAVAISHGTLRELGEMVSHGDRVGAEEWAAQFTENHGIESVAIASEVLGRPVCVGGYCHD